MHTHYISLVDWPAPTTDNVGPTYWFGEMGKNTRQWGICSLHWTAAPGDKRFFGSKTIGKQLKFNSKVEWKRQDEHRLCQGWHFDLKLICSLAGDYHDDLKAQLWVSTSSLVLHLIISLLNLGMLIFLYPTQQVYAVFLLAMAVLHLTQRRLWLCVVSEIFRLFWQRQIGMQELFTKTRASSFWRTLPNDQEATNGVKRAIDRKVL